MIRAAQPLDAGRIGAILSGWVDQTPWMPRLHSRAEDVAHAADLIDRGWVRVAAFGRVAGFLARDDRVIHALYLAPEARGQGIGKALVDDAKAQVPALTLWTFQNNTRARAFYEREGFAEAARTDGAGNDEGLPDIRYDWHREAEA